MDLTFEIGEPAQPRGHALVYFRTADRRILATYVIVPPIAIEFGKYLPPLFTSQLPTLALPQTTAMPFPPLPEVVERFGELERLAHLRGDDLVYGGTLGQALPEELLQVTAEITQAYADRYASYLATAPLAEPDRDRALPEFDTEEVLLALMSDRDRLSELAKRTGQLRYALDGGDAPAVNEAVEAMERVGRHLAAKYRVTELVAAARASGPRGQRLAELYLQRAYKLVAEEFDSLPALEAAIAAEESKLA